MLYTWAVFSTPQATRKHRVFGPHASFIFTVWGGGRGALATQAVRTPAWGSGSVSRALVLRVPLGRREAPHVGTIFCRSKTSSGGGSCSPCSGKARMASRTWMWPSCRPC